MKQATVDKVYQTYSAIEKAEPGISTARLLAMTCDQTKLTLNTVIAALERASKLQTLLAYFAKKRVDKGRMIKGGQA